MAPCVTVLMSAHNSERYLADAIDSIVSQTFSDFEFLIINDGSSDGSRQILEACTDTRIRRIDNGRNLGLSASLNRGFAEATGVYIIRMDADDIALPDRLAKQVAFMEREPNIDVCGSWYEMFGDRNRVVKTQAAHGDIHDTLFFKNCIAHSTVCMRKQSFENCAGPYTEAYRYAQDYELWCRTVNTLAFANIPEVLLRYRVHGLQAGSSHIREQDTFADRVRRNNLLNIGLRLCPQEETIYFDMIAGRFEPGNGNDVRTAARLLEKIYRAGRAGHGRRFQDMLRTYMKPLPAKSVELKSASLSLFAIFAGWGLLPTIVSKARFLRACLKNTAGV
ncbi:MAG: glycosyltransferase [Deltaproteobacteria bacterium]|nr:glycosyltransferase [Deltaproteobacteria bacterium]